jgi:hypothetical protein
MKHPLEIKSTTTDAELGELAAHLAPLHPRLGTATQIIAGLQRRREDMRQRESLRKKARSVRVALPRSANRKSRSA